MLDRDRERNEGYLGPIDLPDQHDASPDDDIDQGADPSLIDDIVDLIDDGRNYLEAEVGYQKSRATYVADRTKGVVVFGLGALGVLHLALIALTVGAVIALAPHVGPWGATAIVAGILLVLVAIFAIQIRKRVRQITAAFAEKDQ